MVVVPAGSLPPDAEEELDPEEQMTACVSGQGPVRAPMVADGFAIGRYEVTFAEWDACVAGGGCAHRPDDRGWGRGDRPVIDVSWQDAQAYVRWLSDVTGMRYTLPTDAEWQYVARAGTSGRFWWGDDVGSDNAHCGGCDGHWDESQTAPVGRFPANPFGLHDVVGNVCELVADCQFWGSGGGWRGPPCLGGSWAAGPYSGLGPWRQDARGDDGGFRVSRPLN